MTDPDRFEAVLHALRERAWDEESARAERVAPLLYGAAANDPARFRRAYYDSAARNVALLENLDRLGRELCSAGLHPVVLKGGDLSERLYPSVAYRPMSDLDLWVEHHEAEAAESVLRRLGLAPFCPEMSPGLARRVRHARLFVEGPLAVDLHWSLVGHASDRRAPSLTWFRGRCVASASGPWRVLDDTASLLYCAAHAAIQHRDERVPLLWLIDFYLLSHRSVDWCELLAAANTFGWSEALGTMSREARQRLGLALPEPLETLESERMAPRGAGSRDARFGVERALRELGNLSWAGRAALAVSYVFPSPSYLRFRYRHRASDSASWSWPRLYAARWASVFASGVSLAAKRIREVRS